MTPFDCYMRTTTNPTSHGYAAYLSNQIMEFNLEFGREVTTPITDETAFAAYCWMQLREKDNDGL